MNRKHVLLRNFFLSALVFLMFFITAHVFFSMTQRSEKRETQMISDAIATRIDEDNESIDTITSANLNSPIIHITFFNLSTNMPVSDNHGINYNENINFATVTYDSLFALTDSSLGNLSYGIYKLNQKRGLATRTIRSVSSGYQVARGFFFYGSPIILAVCIALFFVLYHEFKKELQPLKLQVSKMQAFVQPNHSIEYNDDVSYLAYILRDTRHKLQNQLKETAISNQKVDFILDSFSQGLIVIDPDYKTVLINRKALTIFGKEKEDIQGKYFDSLSAPHELLVNFSMVIQTQKEMTFTTKIDGRVYQCDINPITYSWAKSNIAEEKNGASMLMIDITDDYNSGEMKKEFFANASHELKSPLTSLLGYLQLIENGTIHEKDTVDLTLAKCVNDAQRMDKIITDMLTLSSMEKETLRPIEEINMQAQLDTILELLSLQISDKDITIHKNYQPFPVKMNPDDFERLFKNLIENAVRYNRNKGEIWIDMNSKDQTLSIRDNGIGIAKENQSRIFERFFRVDKARSRKNGGTGLGLAIVKHIANYYDLTVTLDSELEKGSTFTVHFPQV